MEKTTQPTIRKRFDRCSQERMVPFLLTDRDLEIFRHLYRARLLSVDQLYTLLTHEQLRNERPGTTGQGIRRRLKRLFDRGYLDRPPNQNLQRFETDSFQYAGSRPLVYALGRRGAQELATVEGDQTIASVRWAKLNQEIKAPQIDHSLMISQCYVSLLEGLMSAPNRQLKHWLQGQSLCDFFYLDEDGILVAKPDRERIQRERFSRHYVCPDAFFSIWGTDTRQYMNFFLEADRGTMSLERFLEKIRNYVLWKQHRLNVNRFGIEKFVVLTVTESAIRLQNILSAVRKLDSVRSDDFTFRFTCQREYLENPVRFRERIWQVPAVEKSLNLQF
jgi:hypothetical protein